MRSLESFSIRFLAPLSVVVGSLAGAAAGAQSSGRAHPNYDVRASYRVAVVPTAEQLDAAEALPGVTVHWNRQQGVPAVVIRHGGYLSAASTDPSDFLELHARLLRLSSQDLANLEVAGDYVTRHNGSRHLTYRQLDQGRRVYGSQIKVSLDRAGRVVMLGGTYFPGAVAEQPPVLSAAAAVAAAARSVGVRSRRPLAVVARESTAARRTTFKNSLPRRLKEPSPITAELVTFPLPAGLPARIGWQIVLETDSGRYEMVIDGLDGELLYRGSYAAHASPEGSVFVVQNPYLGFPQEVVSFVGAPFNNSGWVTDRTTAGNNVNVYQDLDNDNSPDYQPQTPPAGDPDYQHFNYPFTDAYLTSGRTDVMTDRDAAVTQAFYRINWLHDYFYALGFDEAAGNFQDDNFGRGGVGGDGMLVEVHNGFNVGNPGFSNTDTPADGMRPRMELKAELVDHAMDADVVTHEYTHGVSDRLVCGQRMPELVQMWALGEGWSDFFGTSVWDDPVAGELVCSDPISGCPLYPYDNSPLVYSDLCTLANNNCEPHRDGEIWTAALWDLRAALIDRYGSGPGKSATEQLVVDGMTATPCPANFLQARDALLAADMLTHNGAHQCLIWTVFAGREMGVNASTSADQRTVTADTDVPSTCRPLADAGGPYTTPEGSDQVVDAGASTAGTDPSAGPIVLYEWDLDGDGDYNDATGSSASFTRVGQDGLFPVGLRVTNSAGLTATDSTTVTVTNVTPAVNLFPIDPSVEGTSVSLLGRVTDPGWLDSLSAAVDWDDGNGAQPLPGVLENVRPDATLTFAQDHTYGDDGIFVVGVCASDDDSTACSAVIAEVANVEPTATITPPGQTAYDGVSAFVVNAGGSISVEARSTDPGSDDLTLTWSWGDGLETVVVSLVNPPNPDPAKSPSVQPRDMTLARSHPYGAACLYNVELSSRDDDGGMASDTAAVVIVGNSDRMRGSGWWMNQYRPKPPNHLSPQTLDCYLEIVVFLSTVFDAPLDRAAAVDILFVRRNRGSAEELLDKQLLAAWLNFANGAIGLADLVDTDGDGSHDSTFAAALLQAEGVRNDPTSTRAQLLAQKDILERIVLRDD